MYGDIEMRVFLTLFLMLFSAGTVIAAPASSFLSTENNLFFPVDIVKSAIIDFFPENKQQQAANLYQELMDATTAKISIDSLFKVCRTGGINTYRIEGFDKCRSFVVQMLTDAEIAVDVGLSGSCPAGGDKVNGLRSITDSTRVGDMCSSTNIAYGEVVFRKGYSCTCLAMQCNSGFRFRKRGDCVTISQEPDDINASASNYCARIQTAGAQNNNTSEKCKNFCTNQYGGKNCYWDAVIWDKDKNTCICNPSVQEIADKRKRDEVRRQNRRYINPCDNASRNKGICVDSVFATTNVTRMQATELAKLWAKKHHNDVIECADATESKVDFAGWDDFIMCASVDDDKYYAFRFDDVKESVDADIQAGLVNGICGIYGYSSNVSKNDTLRNMFGGFACNAPCSSELRNAAAHFGLSSTSKGNSCVLSQRVVSKADADKSLAKIDGLDNRYFMGEVLQIQGAQTGKNNIYDYIESKGFLIKSLECIPNPAALEGAWYEDDDDIIRCYLNKQPIDFVFDDVSEAWSYKYEAGEAAFACLGTGGKYEGKECYGLSASQCAKADQTMKRINPGSSGTEWDAKNQVCILIDQSEASFYDGAIQVGTSAIAVVDCMVGTHVGCVMFAVEAASLAADISSKVLIQDRVQEFLRVSTVCKARDCAKNTIRQLGAKVISVKDALDEHSIKNVDEELARLISLLKPEDLQSEVSGSEWNTMVAAAGGATSDWTGTALVWMGRIGVLGQFASLGTSAVNLLRKTPTALRALLSSADNIAAAADDVADATKALVVYDAAKAADTTTDAAKTADTAADVATNATKAADATADATKTTGKVQNIIYDAAYFSRNTPDDVFKNADDLVQIKRGDIQTATLKDLMKKAKEYGFECSDCGGDVLKFTKIVEKTTGGADAVKTANVVTDTARGATSATDNAVRALPALPAKAADATADAGKATNVVHTATGAASGATNAATDGVSISDDIIKSVSKMTWDQKLKAVGIREVLDKRGAVRYFDEFNGTKPISADNAMKRIEKLPEIIARSRKMSDTENFALVGVKEVVDKNGQYRYFDTLNKTKRISGDEALNHIDETYKAIIKNMENAANTATDAATNAGKAADATADAAMGANKAADASRTAGKVLNNANTNKKMASITQKLGGGFDELIDNVKNGSSKGFFVEKNKLSVDEWKTLRESLRTEGIEIVEGSIIEGGSKNFFEFRKIGAANAAADAAAEAKKVTTWAEDMASIGVKYTPEDLATVGIKYMSDGSYVDIATGKKLTDIQVLNRIPTSANDYLAKYGVRQIELPNGGVRYKGTLPSDKGHLISEYDALMRVDNGPIDIVNKTDDLLPAVVNKTDNLLPAVVNKTDDVSVVPTVQKTVPAWVDAVSATAKATGLSYGHHNDVQ